MAYFPWVLLRAAPKPEVFLLEHGSTTVRAAAFCSWARPFIFTLLYSPRCMTGYRRFIAEGNDGLASYLGGA